MLRIFYIIAIFTSLLITKPLQAEDTAVNVFYPITCELTPKALELVKQFKEIPVFIGKDFNNNAELVFSIFYNEKTETFTALLGIEDNSYLCMLAAGRNGKVFLPKPGNPS